MRQLNTMRPNYHRLLSTRDRQTSGIREETVTYTDRASGSTIRFYSAACIVLTARRYAIARYVYALFGGPAKVPASLGPARTLTTSLVDAQQGGCVDSRRCGAFDYLKKILFCLFLPSIAYYPEV